MKTSTGINELTMKNGSIKSSEKLNNVCLKDTLAHTHIKFCIVLYNVKPGRNNKWS